MTSTEARGIHTRGRSFRRSPGWILEGRSPASGSCSPASPSREREAEKGVHASPTARTPARTVSVSGGSSHWV